MTERFSVDPVSFVHFQIRTIDKARLVRHLGRIDSRTRSRVLDTLQEMFSP